MPNKGRGRCLMNSREGEEWFSGMSVKTELTLLWAVSVHLMLDCRKRTWNTWKLADFFHVSTAEKLTTELSNLTRGRYRQLSQLCSSLENWFTVHLVFVLEK